MISLLWTLTSGTKVSRYNISYYTDETCFSDSGTISVDSDTVNYTLRGLEEHTQYVITVTALNQSYVVGNDIIKVTTLPVGK